MNLTQTLIHLRKQQGLSQIELAEALDVSRQTVSKWETGAVLPSAENLLALSKLYGVSTDALLKGQAEAMEKPLDLLPAPAVCLPTPKRALAWRPPSLRLMGTVLLFDLLLFLLEFYLGNLSGTMNGLCSLLRILGCCLIGFLFARQERIQSGNQKTLLIIFSAALALGLYVFLLPTPLLWRLYDLVAWIGAPQDAILPTNPCFFFLGWTLFDSSAVSAHLFLIAAFCLGQLRFSTAVRPHTV